MTTTKLTLDATGDRARLTADTCALHELRNAMFTAHFDGRMSEEDAERFRAAIPHVNADGDIAEATFTVDRETLTGLADGLEEAARHHRAADRDATADGLDNTASRFRFHTAKLPYDSA